MHKIANTHHIMARAAAAIAVVSVLLAILSKLIDQTLFIYRPSYLTIATVALLFAIYFIVEGWADAAKKAE